MTNNKCKEYHDWEVFEVNGTLPYQEIVLKCKNCEAEKDVSFDYKS